MTVFIRALERTDKAACLRSAAVAFDRGDSDADVFCLSSKDFQYVPGVPFAYWVQQEIRDVFKAHECFDNATVGRTTRCGLGTLDDFRFLRLFWEVDRSTNRWITYYHGGVYSPFYDNFPVVVNWQDDGGEIKVFVEQKVGSASRKVQAEDYYFKPGFVFPRRTKALAPKFMPKGGIFSTAGQAGFTPISDISATIALLSSRICSLLISLSQGRTGDAAQFEVGLVKRLPWPDIEDKKADLELLALNSWSLTRSLNSTLETSHSFIFPEVFLARLGRESHEETRRRLRANIESINGIACELYGFTNSISPSHMEDEIDLSIPSAKLDEVDSLLSWCVGVLFGRFDVRLATGEREMPQEPAPLDPLPIMSPGMLPDSSAPFHSHNGVLVVDKGHRHDLVRLIESLLEHLGLQVPDSLENWIKKVFFGQHLKLYSDARRKAPIYWPLATSSGSYTLWIYCPELDDQTLYTAVNDFIEPKLKSVEDALNTLHVRSSRTTSEERELEEQQDLQQELIELRDTILQIASNYKPNQDDGVQITAAPLWPMFRHKPWQKALKDTWDKLEAGEYDWAHIAYSYWPDRVREKCKTDKSLAIAHGLEEVFVSG